MQILNLLLGMLVLLQTFFLENVHSINHIFLYEIMHFPTDLLFTCFKCNFRLVGFVLSLVQRIYLR
jgi:hypothetical protein